LGTLASLYRIKHQRKRELAEDAVGVEEDATPGYAAIVKGFAGGGLNDAAFIHLLRKYNPRPSGVGLRKRPIQRLYLRDYRATRCQCPIV